MVEYLEHFLSERGFSCERQEVEPGRPNLIARAGASTPTRRFCFEAHTDTVAVEGMTIDPFTPVMKDGKLYARGSCDTKGPMSAALSCFTSERLAAARDRGVELCFVGSMGEEKGLSGARHLAESGFSCDAAIILEPTRLEPVIAHKGACWAHVSMTGKSGHGSNPTPGPNAIRGAARFIEQVYQQQMPEDGILGPGTINVGRIEGGTAMNIVAGECQVTLDRRFLPQESVDDIVAGWKELLDELVGQTMLVSYHIEVDDVLPPFSTPADAGLVRVTLNELEKLGRPTSPQGAPWCSDAVPFSTVCPEVIVFGPGDIAQAHTKDEFIDLNELEQGAVVLGRIFDAWLSHIEEEVA